MLGDNNLFILQRHKVFSGAVMIPKVLEDLQMETPGFICKTGDLDSRFDIETLSRIGDYFERSSTICRTMVTTRKVY